MPYKYILLSMIAGLLVTQSRAQSLDNASFEGEPQDATMPMGWFICTEGTTPDILPGPWGVTQNPVEGSTYVGLITRPDGSQESIGQRFSMPLDQDQCYKLSFDLARSPTYADYNSPVRLRVWVSEKKCQRQKLIVETEDIKHLQWKTYSYKIHTDRAYEYIIFEAWFPDEQMTSAGNILIDHIRQISKCPGA